MTQLRAISKGKFVLEGEYQIHSPYERVLNYSRLGSDNEISLSLAIPEIGEGPSTIVVNILPLDPKKILVCNNCLLIDGQVIHLPNECYVGAIIKLELLPEEIIHRAELVIQYVKQITNGESLFYLLGENGPKTDSKFLQVLFEEFDQAFLALKKGALDFGLSQMIGKGLGVTPQGDDFVLGALTALKSVEKMLNYHYQATLKNDFNFSSAITKKGFRELKENEVAKITKDFLEVFSKKSLQDFLSSYQEVTNKLIHVGHTSGEDFISGLLFIYQRIKLWC